MWSKVIPAASVKNLFPVSGQDDKTLFFSFVKVCLYNFQKVSCCFSYSAFRDESHSCGPKTKLSYTVFMRDTITLEYILQSVWRRVIGRSVVAELLRVFFFVYQDDIAFTHVFVQATAFRGFGQDGVQAFECYILEFCVEFCGDAIWAICFICCNAEDRLFVLLG